MPRAANTDDNRGAGNVKVRDRLHLRRHGGAEVKAAPWHLERRPHLYGRTAEGGFTAVGVGQYLL